MAKKTTVKMDDKERREEGVVDYNSVEKESRQEHFLPVRNESVKNCSCFVVVARQKKAELRSIEESQNLSPFFVGYAVFCVFFSVRQNPGNCAVTKFLLLFKGVTSQRRTCSNLFITIKSRPRFPTFKLLEEIVRKL